MTTSKRIAVKVGEYTDRSGQTKGRWKTLGELVTKDDIKLATDAEGCLSLAAHDKLLMLSAAQTLALGDFLHGTQPIWRP